jgi:hypothetical protein
LVYRMEEPVKKTYLTLDIPAELQKAIKIDAARQGTSRRTKKWT